MRGAIQLFEHQRLRVGETYPASGGVLFTKEHFEALTRYAERHRAPPFEIRHRSVVFKQYVGVIQVGGLTLEILPKADREAHRPGEVESPTQWRKVLLQMLRLCPQLGLREVQRAELGTEPVDLLDLYIARFLSEVTRLVHEGLARSYPTVERNQTAFSGRLLVAENIRTNIAHAERVYVATHELSTDRLENRILWHALRVLCSLRIRRSLREHAEQLLREFPTVSPRPVALEDFARIAPGRHIDRYAEALALARLILLHHSPAPRSGGEDTLALLIDMNRLFQGFVLGILRRTAPEGWSVEGNASADFWPEHAEEPKRLWPDIVIKRGDETMLVIDTKWKLPDGGWPGDGDLRQVFAYGEYFGAQRTVLLYPAGKKAVIAPPAGQFLKRKLRCEVHHFDMLDEWDGRGRIDLEKVGQSLWHQLWPR